MSALHTPGPWFLGAACGLLGQWIDTAEGVHIGSVRVDNIDNTADAKYCATTPYPAGIANAKLIAAAPDLLELARYVVAECEGPDAADPQKVLRMLEGQASAVIAKATGATP